jgi:hypothetical protein
VRQTRLYSYVVERDTGHAPNPYFGVCTLCRCKFRASPTKPRNIVELAEKGDWIVGTGGANARRSAGNGNLLYAMRVDEKLSREEYFSDRRFVKKKPLASGTFAMTRGDNVCPTYDFEKFHQFALISRHFYYFGANAIRIPERFSNLEKKGPGFKCRFDSSYVDSFISWLDANWKAGKHAEPCQSKPVGLRRCKSCC